MPTGIWLKRKKIKKPFFNKRKKKMEAKIPPKQEMRKEANKENWPAKMKENVLECLEIMQAPLLTSVSTCGITTIFQSRFQALRSPCSFFPSQTLFSFRFSYRQLLRGTFALLIWQLCFVSSKARSCHLYSNNMGKGKRREWKGEETKSKFLFFFIFFI